MKYWGWAAAILISIILVFLIYLLWQGPVQPTLPPPTPASPLPTPTPTPVVVSPLPTPAARAVEAQAGRVVTGTIAVFWRDPVGPDPQEVVSNGTITSELFIDLELRLENGETLTQTIITGLSAPDEPGEFQFNGSFDYEWQSVPFGVHAEYARLRWELASSEVLVVTEVGTYALYQETVYGVLVVDGQLAPLDERQFGLYRTVGQYYYYYLPLILNNGRP